MSIVTEKSCSRCGESKPLSHYCRMAKTSDGLHCWCRDCRAAYMRQWRKNHPDPSYSTDAIRRMRVLHPERQAARSKIDALVARGDMQPARAFPCQDCGEQAKQYDHARGYEPPNDLSVEPVCTACHGLRSRERGEHGGRTPKAGGRELDGRTWDEFPAVAS